MPQDPEVSRALGLTHGQVCYLQLPAADRDRAAAFYRTVFGWQTETYHGLRIAWPHRPVGRGPSAGPRRRAGALARRRRHERDARSGHPPRRPDPGAARLRRPDPHPGHDRRLRRQPGRPGGPRATAVATTLDLTAVSGAITQCRLAYFDLERGCSSCGGAGGAAESAARWRDC
jgi:hypothetical protein